MEKQSRDHGLPLDSFYGVTDEVVLERFAKGAPFESDAAWREFDRRYRDIAYKAAMKRMLGQDEEGAREAAQEAMLDAAQQLKTQPVPPNIAAWIQTIAYRRATDALRKERGSNYRRQRPISIDAGAEEGKTIPFLRAETPSPDDRADRERVRKLIGRLPKQQAEIVRLFYFEELQQQEIAARLGITPSRISQLLKEAHEALGVKAGADSVSRKKPSKLRPASAAYDEPEASAAK